MANPQVSLEVFKSRYFDEFEINADPSITSNDNDSNYEDGNFDNDVYAEFQQSTPWSTIANVISKSNFIGISAAHEDCMLLAQAQIAQKGLKISKYDAVGQTIKTYTAANGADINQAKVAVTYLSSQLAIGHPIIVGVDCAPGASPSNTDHSTDHFIVIVGMGTDNNGKFFRFFDSSTSNENKGASSNNKLYFNETTGKLSGSTQSQYGTRAPYMHPYIVTQIRKNKK